MDATDWLNRSARHGPARLGVAHVPVRAGTLPARNVAPVPLPRIHLHGLPLHIACFGNVSLTSFTSHKEFQADLGFSGVDKYMPCTRRYGSEKYTYGDI